MRALIISQLPLLQGGGGEAATAGAHAEGCRRFPRGLPSNTTRYIEAKDDESLHTIGISKNVSGFICENVLARCAVATTSIIHVRSNTYMLWATCHVHTHVVVHVHLQYFNSLTQCTPSNLELLHAPFTIMSIK